MKWAAVVGANYWHFACCSIARYRGLERCHVFGPGVYTPGFMLAPALQAKLPTELN